jgi:hypothetical protein
MPSVVETLFRGALQLLWPTAGGLLTSAEMHAYFQDVGLNVSPGALQSAWSSHRDRGQIRGAMVVEGGFSITWVDPSLLALP